MGLKQNHRLCATDWEHLQQVWRRTRAEWNDNVRVQFEQQFWEPIEHTLPQFLEVLDQLARVEEQARMNVH